MDLRKLTELHGHCSLDLVRPYGDPLKVRTIEEGSRNAATQLITSQIESRQQGVFATQLRWNATSKLVFIDIRL
jgi:hypothetical protein